MKRHLLTASAAVALVLGLAGCGDDAVATSDAAPTTSTGVVSTPEPSASATPEAVAATPDGSGTTSAAVEPGDALSAAGFAPRPFSTTEDLLSQTFPGLAATDPTCLQPFGSDWAADPSLAGAAMAWGSTTDYAMAAAVTHTESADLAADLLDAMRTAVATCAATDGGFSVHDIALEMTVESIDTGLDGVDDSAGWTASTTVGDTEYSLVGMTARDGASITIVLSTSPSTTRDDVAAKLEQLTDQL